MKHTILACLLMSTLFCYAQDDVYEKKTNPTPLNSQTSIPTEIDPTTGKYVLERVIEYAGTKEQLYDKALTFFAKNQGWSNLANQVRDKEGGRLITKASLKVYPFPSSVSANIVLLFKDGKYRFTITDFERNEWNIGRIKYKSWLFEQEVTFFTHDVTKKDQEKIRQASFKAYLDVMEKMKISFAKNDDF